MTPPSPLSRRDVLHRSAAWSAAGLAAPGWIGACAPGSRAPSAVAPAGAGESQTDFVPVRETCVREHRGSPALFINGRPHAGLTFFFARVQDSAEDIRRFAAAGIHLFSGCFGVGRWVDGRWDFEADRKRFEYVLAANPQALILPRVGLHGARSPWSEAHPDEVQIDVHPHTGAREPARWFSFSSPAARRVYGQALREFIRDCETRYGDHIVGYHLAGGATGEWSYGWRPALSDYCPAQEKAFRRWLRRRYQDDRQKLRHAWKQSDADFDTAAVPLVRARDETQLSLFDPATERPLIDYLTFHSEAVADAILYYCGLCKETLRELGRRKICGVFYGYHFKNMNRPANFHNQGHGAATPLLTSPDVDFFCAPYDYSGREPGTMYLSQLVAGSVRLHGKLYYCEDDTFTFLSKREPHRSWCPDRESSIGVLRRNLAGILRDGGTAWYMDCGGNGPPNPAVQVDGWYRDEGLMLNFAAMQRLASERLARRDLTTCAEVAVVVGGAGIAAQRQDPALADALLFHQVLDLAALGASFDTYRAEDLERLMRQPWAAAYRLVIFLDALILAPREREVIDRQLKRDGRTLLWVYAPGLVTDDAFSPEALHAATGFRLGLRRASEPLMVHCVVTGSRVLYGTERPVGPVVFGADPDAAVEGWFLNTGDPGFLARDFGAWRSVWSGAPAIPAVVLRHIARQAGVHLYVETGDQVLCERGLLAIHAGFDGERTVRLPRAGDVRDAFTGREVGRGVREFRVSLRRAETAIWAVDES
jgi:beta-galactosidase